MKRKVSTNILIRPSQPVRSKFVPTPQPKPAPKPQPTPTKTKTPAARRVMLAKILKGRIT